MDDKIEAWRHGLLRLVLQHARAYADNSDPAKTEAAYVAICDYLRTTPEGYRLVPVEPDDEQIRRALAVVNPSIYGHSLRDPRNGPNLSANVEKNIATMRKQYSAMLAASQESGT